MSTEPEYRAAEYLCYQVIYQMEDRGQEVPETSFNKLCALVHERVGNEEIELPYNWYQYGYVVRREHLRQGFLRERNRTDWTNSGTQITIDDIDDSAFEVVDEVKQTIKSAATSLAEMFEGTYSSSKIKNYSYDHQAPNEFIVVMNQFREVLADMDIEGAADRDEHVRGVDISFNKATGVEPAPKDIDSSEVEDEEIQDFLRQLGLQYPEEIYTQMEPFFYEWKTMCKELIRHDLYSELRQFQKEFWNTFSKVELRIHHRKNIPLGQRRRWNNARSEHIADFEEELATKRNVVQAHREPTDRLGSVGEAYDAAVDDISGRLIGNK